MLHRRIPCNTYFVIDSSNSDDSALARLFNNDTAIEPRNFFGPPDITAVERRITSMTTETATKPSVDPQTARELRYITRLNRAQNPSTSFHVTSSHTRIVESPVPLYVSQRTSPDLFRGISDTPLQTAVPTTSPTTVDSALSPSTTLGVPIRSTSPTYFTTIRPQSPVRSLNTPLQEARPFFFCYFATFFCIDYSTRTSTPGNLYPPTLPTY